MKLVIIESPYAGDIELNLRYLRACMADCIARGEAPYASHGLYTQPGVLRDEDPAERELGIRAGLAWRQVAEMTVVYTDFGISKGMQYGIDDARKRGVPVESRQLGGIWSLTRPTTCGHAEEFDEAMNDATIEFATSIWGDGLGPIDDEDQASLDEQKQDMIDRYGSPERLALSAPEDIH